MLTLKRWFSSNNDSSNNDSNGKDKIRTSSISIRKKLDETLVKLEGKERVLQSKISIENERARDFTKSKNKKAALECLKRKNYYESQREHLGSFRLQVNDQMRMLEDVTDMADL